MRYKKYTKLTKEQKINLIKDYEENKQKINDILKKYNISRGTLYNILRNN